MNNSVEVSHQDLVSFVTITKGPYNLLTNELITEIIAAHQKADEYEGTRIIVTRSGVPNMFSHGLDPQYVLDKNQKERSDVFKYIAKLFYGLYSLNKIHICLVEGPAMAGGAVLALTSDFRYFQKESGRISFSETKVGLPMPKALASAIRAVCSPSYFNDIVLLGRNMDAQDALVCGLADEVVEASQFDDFCAKQFSRMSRLSQKVLSHTKKHNRADTLTLALEFVENQNDLYEFLTDDYLGEGLRSLLEKRYPHYQY